MLATDGLRAGVVLDPPERMTAEVVVVGSGPAGAVTGSVLAEAGCDVLILEEGPLVAADAHALYSSSEMEAKYRNGGITAAIGRPTVAYVEGRCVGGGAEVNGGLWFRTPSDVLDRWEYEHGVRLEGLDVDLDQLESDLGGVSEAPPSPAGDRLREGARALGWPSFEARCTLLREGTAERRRGMSTTFLPRALRAGARLAPDVRVSHVEIRRNVWVVHASLDRDGSTRKLLIEASTVFVCAGAIQSPSLLRRSGLAPSAGRGLMLHATLKVVAKFAETVNPLEGGRTRPRIPGAMIDAFGPGTNLECAVSGRGHLALELAHHRGGLTWLDEVERVAGYAARIHLVEGSVATIPGLRDPIVRATWPRAALRELSSATKRLCRALLAAGATEILPAIHVDRPIRGESDVDRLPDKLDRATLRPMTIHLSSTCRMGRPSAGAVVDVSGRVFGAPRLFVSDSSVLPTAPRVNPQGTIMAVARRNARLFLEERASRAFRSRTE